MKIVELAVIGVCLMVGYTVGYVQATNMVKRELTKVFDEVIEEVQEKEENTTFES